MSCTLSAIVAVSDDWGIGYEGDMIVRNRADMRRFVELTTGHPVIMGRTTLESFPGGRPLKSRRNIVLSRDPAYTCEDAEVVHSVEEALAAVADEDEAWVIGGEQVYRALLPYCTRAEVTKTHCLRLADTHFPNLDEDDGWTVAHESEVALIAPDEEDHGIEYRFVTYVRAGADAADAAEDEDEAADGAPEPTVHLKTMILYRSKHHGNTKKLVDAIAAAYPDDVDTLDVSTVKSKDKRVDLSSYQLIGAASGIYFGEIDKQLGLVLQNSLRDGDFVFSLLTYGGAAKWYGRDIDGICRTKRATLLAGYGCPGYDTWGPFRLTGGIQKGRPTQEEIDGAATWFGQLVADYGEPIMAEYRKRQRRDAWNAQHPDPTLVDKLKNTGRSLIGRKNK